MGKYFGTDGFRGEANADLTFEHAVKIGRFLGWYYGAKEGKKAKLHIHLPGDDLIIEKVADTFENAVTGAVDAMKEKLTRVKERVFDK